MLALAVASTLVLLYIYAGYRAVLQVLSLGKKPAAHAAPTTGLPATTILITVHNEERDIEARIDNALALTPLPEQFQILVASDASTDGTDQIVQAHPDPRVDLIQMASNSGKTAAQNLAIKTAMGDVVVFTDADSRFEVDFLGEVLRPFADSRVGLVDPCVRFFESKSAIGAGQSDYWRQEQKIRALESGLGILAVASGAGLAVRRSLILPMREDVGEDCLLPLQVVSQGFRVEHQASAIVHDRMPDATGGEFRTRVRMTARNVVGTLSHSSLINPFRHPGIAFSLWSHKLLRWSSPIWILTLCLATMLIGFKGGAWAWAWVIPSAISIGGLLGWAGDRVGLRIPLASSVWALLLANAGFTLGLVKAACGRTHGRYNRG